MNRIKILLMLHLFLLIYSMSSVCSKMAAMQQMFSSGFIIYYIGMIVFLAIYAVGWQQIIKRMPLTTAFSNKAVTVVWGSIWGILLFHEKVSIMKMIGIAVIVAGVILYSYADKEV